jgi:DNA polymerase III delta prime subunit
MIHEDFLWVEKYRPRTVSETILPAEMKKMFQKFVTDQNIPNLLLCGRPGIGKTTIARAMLEELGCDYIVINGSLDRNIDTLRNDIMVFASSVSLTGGRKYVILDEADNLNAQSTQKALRNFMEEFSSNCGFILTANYPNKIIEALHSRCSIINFRIPREEKAKLAGSFFKRLCKILELEGVEFEQKAVAVTVERFFPDWRRTLNEIQAYSSLGKIDVGILSNLNDQSYRQLIGFLKEKDFTNTRKWVAENSDIEPTEVYRKFYETATDFLTPSSIPQLVLFLADYSYKSAFVADQEINTTAFLIECMAELEFRT